MVHGPCVRHLWSGFPVTSSKCLVELAHTGILVPHTPFLLLLPASPALKVRPSGLWFTCASGPLVSFLCERGMRLSAWPCGLQGSHPRNLWLPTPNQTGEKERVGASTCIQFLKSKPKILCMCYPVGGSFSSVYFTRLAHELFIQTSIPHIHRPHLCPCSTA